MIKGVLVIVLDSNGLKPKMILAKPVHDLQGVLLLRQETKLSEKNIRMLKSWGVNEIWVRGGSKEGADKNTVSADEIKESVEKGLKEKFSKVIDDTVMAEIMRVAVDRLTIRSLKKAGENEPR